MVPRWSRSQEKGMHTLAFFLFHLYFVWEPSPWDGAVHILGRSSDSVTPYWKYLPTYPRQCASTSLVILNTVKLKTKTNDINKDMNKYTCSHEHTHRHKLTHSESGFDSTYYRREIRGTSKTFKCNQPNNNNQKPTFTKHFISC